jgi:hypothetical protein
LGDPKGWWNAIKKGYGGVKKGVNWSGHELVVGGDWVGGVTKEGGESVGHYTKEAAEKVGHVLKEGWDYVFGGGSTPAPVTGPTAQMSSTSGNGSGSVNTGLFSSGTTGGASLSSQVDSGGWGGGNARTEAIANLRANDITMTRTDGRTIVTFDLAVQGPPSITTTYFNGAGPQTGYAGGDGTLGDHEAQHRASLAEWWTTDNVRAIAQQEGFSTSLTLSGNPSARQALSAVRTQMNDINWTLSQMSNRHEAETIDHREPILVPFLGIRD